MEPVRSTHLLSGAPQKLAMEQRDGDKGENAIKNNSLKGVTPPAGGKYQFDAYNARPRPPLRLCFSAVFSYLHCAACGSPGIKG